jgi:hypothetical protein
MSAKLDSSSGAGVSDGSKFTLLMTAWVDLILS